MLLLLPAIASNAVSSGVLSATYEVVVERHVSELMSLFVRLPIAPTRQSAFARKPASSPPTHHCLTVVRASAPQLADDLAGEWNPRLASATFVDTNMGQLVHQEYAMPWPLANRDMLMQCTTTVTQRETRVQLRCWRQRFAQSR